MATYFQVVKQVLDGLYEDLPTKDRDQSITNALQILSNKYQNVLQQGGPDYGSAEAKFAYVFRYTTAHADFLDSVIRRSDEVKALLKRDSLVVSYVGGGPGSDILASSNICFR